MDPDVIALQEVGSPEAIADLQAALDGVFPNAAVSKCPDRRGIRVALLAKRKLHAPVDAPVMAEFEL